MVAFKCCDGKQHSWVSGGRGQEECKEKLYFLHCVGDAWRETCAFLGLTGRWLIQPKSALCGWNRFTGVKNRVFPDGSSIRSPFCLWGKCCWVPVEFPEDHCKHHKFKTSAPASPQHPFPSKELARTQGDRSPQEFGHIFLGPSEFNSWLCLGKSCPAATTLPRINQLSSADVRVPLQD